MKTVKTAAFALALAALIPATAARADDPAPETFPASAGRRIVISRDVRTVGPGPMPFEIAVPPFLGELFQPALVMQHQKEIALRDDQRAAISSVLKDTQSRVVDLEWEIQGATQALEALMREDRIDEKAALAEVERLMRAEQEVKKAHLSLLIRVKNQLTPEQQRTLRTKRPGDVLFFRAPLSGAPPWLPDTAPLPPLPER
jgi:Spy/CpxP family protein refolding chaperone